MNCQCSSSGKAHPSKSRRSLFHSPLTVKLSYSVSGAKITAELHLELFGIAVACFRERGQDTALWRRKQSGLDQRDRSAQRSYWLPLLSLAQRRPWKPLVPQVVSVGLKIERLNSSYRSQFLNAHDWGFCVWEGRREQVREEWLWGESASLQLRFSSQQCLFGEGVSSSTGLNWLQSSIRAFSSQYIGKAGESRI